MRPEFGQAVNVAYLACLAEQLAQCSHLPIDGCIAVASLAERSDQAVQRVLAKVLNLLLRKISSISPKKDLTFSFCLPSSHRIGP